MVLAIICLVMCMLFGLVIVGSVLKKPLFWIQEFSPEVQKRYLELHPEVKVPSKGEATKILVLKKPSVATLFVFILAGIGYLSGAREYSTAFINIYIIWAVVNVFDVIVLDLWILARWKKVRLPGTENMDKEYRGNNRKHIVDGIYGLLIGLPVSLVAAWLLESLLK